MALLEEMENQGNYLFRQRGKLPILLLPFGLGIYVYQEWVRLGKPGWPGEEVYPYLCLAIALLGLAVRVYTVGHTPRNTSGRNTARQVADELNTQGIYSIVRHPLYLGNFLIWLSIAMLTENAWFVICFSLCFWIYYERIMLAEEQFLRARFKQSYTEWAARTPAFIPDFRLYQRAHLPFSYKKALKKEKTGLFAIFILFFLFQYAEDIILRASFAPVWDFWTLALISSALFYLTLKIIKKRTPWLNEINR